MLRTVFEPLDVFEWNSNFEYGSKTWDMLEAWAGEPLEIGDDGTAMFGTSKLNPGDFLVKAKTPGAAAFVVSKEYYDKYFVTVPTLPQP